MGGFTLSISFSKFDRIRSFFWSKLSFNGESEIDFKKIKNYRLAKYLSKVSYEDTKCRSSIFITEI